MSPCACRHILISDTSVTVSLGTTPTHELIRLRCINLQASCVLYDESSNSKSISPCACDSINGRASAANVVRGKCGAQQMWCAAHVVRDSTYVGARHRLWAHQDQPVVVRRERDNMFNRLRALGARASNSMSISPCACSRYSVLNLAYSVLNFRTRVWQ